MLKKKYILIYLVSLHLFLIVILVKSNTISLVERKLGIPSPSTELTSYYKTLVVFQQRIDKNSLDKAIIFIGDSHTQGLSTTAIHTNSINFGIASDTTIGVLNRIPLYSSIKHAKAIVLAVGINDLFIRTNSDTLKNLKQILKLLPKRIPVIVCAIFPVAQLAPEKSNLNKRIKSLNSEIKKLTQQNKNLHFLSINKLLLNGGHTLSKQYHIGDGIHLNTAGYKLWINELHKKLKLLNSSLERK